MRDPVCRFSKAYLKWRKTPPTVIGLMLKPAMLLLLIGVVCTGLLVALDLPIAWPIFFAGVIVGAICRELGFSLKLVKYWPAFSQILDWKKIEETAGEAEHEKSSESEREPQ